MTEQESIEHQKQQEKLENEFLDVAIEFIEKGAHPERLRRTLHRIEGRLARDRYKAKT